MQIQSCIFRIVDSAEIHHQSVINKHPNIIVASESKGLSPLVSKSQVNFQSKVVVAIVVKVAEAAIVNGEELVVLEAKHRRIARRRIANCVVKRQIVWDQEGTLCGSPCIEPIPKGTLRMNCPMRQRTKNGLPIGSQRALNKSRPREELILKIRMA